MMNEKEARKFLENGEELLWDNKEKEYYDYIMTRWPELLSYTQKEIAKGNNEPAGYDGIFLVNFVMDIETAALNNLKPAEFIDFAKELVTIAVDEAGRTAIESDITRKMAEEGRYEESCKYIDEKLAKSPKASNLINGAMMTAAENNDKERTFRIIETYIGNGEKLDREGLWMLDNVYKVYMDFGEKEKAEAIKSFVKSYDAGSKRQFSIERIGKIGETYKHDSPKVGRNDPCPCGSGKKYKKCCGKN